MFFGSVAIKLFFFLSVCLSVCKQHYPKSFERVAMKFYGGVKGARYNKELVIGGSYKVSRSAKKNKNSCSKS